MPRGTDELEEGHAADGYGLRGCRKMKNNGRKSI